MTFEWQIFCLTNKYIIVDVDFIVLLQMFATLQLLLPISAGPVSN